jgi:hypothetical protein
MFTNLFGKKKDTPAASTVSATSVVRAEDSQTTIVQLRDSIANQEKRYVPSGASVSILTLFASHLSIPEKNILIRRLIK